MALEKFRAAPLPSPAKDYDPQYIRQLIRTIELYFSQLDSKTPNYAQSYRADEFIGGSFAGTDITVDSVSADFLSAAAASIGYERANGVWTDALISYGHSNGRQISNDIMAGTIYANTFYGSGEHIRTFYNQLISNTTQTAAAIDQAYAITFDVNVFPGSVTIVSGSRITFEHEGVYLITPSIELQSTSTISENVNVWYRKNGVDIANSNVRYGISARKSATIPAAAVAVSPYIISVNANDYIQIMWNPSDTLVTIPNFAAKTFSAGVNPTIPATPSVHCNIGFVSAKFPEPTFAAPLPVFSFGAVGNITVRTT